MRWDTTLTLKERELDEQARTSKYGPPPINIFTELRERRDLTISDLSRISHIDPMALNRAEAGTYTNPLPSLVDFWVSQRASFSEIHESYSDFQLTQRRRHQHYFGPNLLLLNSDAQLETIHPFRLLRLRRPSLHDGSNLPVGNTEVSKALCVPLDTIQFFEKKYATQQSVPKSIKLALNQINYTDSQINDFENWYKRWRDYQIKDGIKFS